MKSKDPFNHVAARGGELVYLVFLVYLLSLVSLVSLNMSNKIDQTNRINWISLGVLDSLFVVCRLIWFISLIWFV